MKEMIKVVISKNAPRPQTILLQFKKYSGLKIRFFLGFFSLCGFLFTAIVTAYVFTITPPELKIKSFLFGIIFCSLWLPFLYFFKQNVDYSKKRINLLTNGICVDGKIIKKQAQYRSFVLKILITKPDKSFCEINYRIQNFFLYQSLKLNSVHTGLWDPHTESYFFPFEMNAIIIPKD
jgi:hypothetical protein